MEITPQAKRALLSKDTSRQNKLWLVAGWTHFHGWFIEYKWKGVLGNSRLLFRFSENENFTEAESFDEDVLPTFKFGKENK